MKTDGNDFVRSGMDGLTKREEFAKAALQGLLAANPSITNFGEAAVAFADALIEALNAKEGT